MKALLWSLTLATALVFPVVYFIKENPLDATSFLSWEEKKAVAWQRVRMQVNPGRKSHLEAFKAMQRSSEPIRHVKSRVLLGALPVEKKLLTIGISLGRRPRGSALVHTLQRLFLASSPAEQRCFTVVVQLADPDPKWQDQTLSSLSALFQPHVLAGRLLVITPPPQSYRPLKNPKKTFRHSPACGAFRPEQNLDYAFLMNFAVNCSDYFLVMDDDVQCAPGFVTHIAATLATWEWTSWVTLEFSQLGLTGKLFRTRDLPGFVRFLLLFHQTMPCRYLLSHFQDVLQQKPIQFSPSLFWRVGNASSTQDKLTSLRETEPEESDADSPSNPAATIYSNLNVTNSSTLMNAYSLDRTVFSTREATAGSHLTVILDTPARVSRVQVLTGSELDKESRVKEGQVELGYDTTNLIDDCDDYVLLGLLVNGVLNKQVLSEKSAKKVKCVRLLVTATLPSGFTLRHINLWTR
ncbi:alpha-1,3-mannosyl-glycoprotein 4-beta-N-acetylglucosaminyltransferase C [Oryctolagus cuniculus]|uniref:alpha-1,3-mannosyl-glycoprotein 4-beta-N-acetylglucosaminyltransferase C n=1 Tax=Oryctolagus cuniculus TaxID=9986 RepID=UPI003879D842